LRKTGLRSTPARPRVLLVEDLCAIALNSAQYSARPSRSATGTAMRRSWGRQTGTTAIGAGR